MTQPRVLLDACVLVPITLTNLLLRLAEDSAFEPIWSETILQEAFNAVQLLQPPDSVASFERRFLRMREAFPRACVYNFDDVENDLVTYWPDPKDAHVVAAAIHGGAAMIVTNNLKDFPAKLLKPLNTIAISADQFLLEMLEINEEQVMKCVSEQARVMSKPPRSLVELVEALRKVVPEFAENLMRLLDSSR